MIEQPQKSQANNFVYGVLFGMLAGTAVYGVTQWIPAIGLGPLFGLCVGILVSVVQQSRKK